jgi:molecular chaperone DnaK (HSP70)
VRLGLDFGTGSVVIAVYVPGQDTRTLEFLGLSRPVQAVPGDIPVHITPALVEYRDGKPFRRGEAVLREGTADAPSTARWMRRSLCDRSPVQVPAGGSRRVRYEEAAADLLAPLLTEAFREYPGAPLTVSLPPDAPAEFGELLRRIAPSTGARSCSVISEYDAVLAGYGCIPEPGEPFILVSFSEADLEVVALVQDGSTATGAGEYGRLRVLARAVAPSGCHAVDTWIVRDLIRKFRLLESDPRAVRLLPNLRYEAARLREELAVRGASMVRLTDAVSGKTFSAEYATADLDRLLADNGLIVAVQECTGRARSAIPPGDAEGSRIRSVFFTGAGCALPGVQGAVQSCLAGAGIYADHLLDAVARGAAEWSAPQPAQDRLTRSYALRYWDPAVQEHHYRFIVQSGTRYPSVGEVARIVISAAYDGQTLLGIPLYEIGGTAAGSGPQIELVSDTGGGVRLAGPAQDADGSGQAVHANERSPTLLVATPPARKGEPRFECTFTIDPERNLCLSARDLITGMLVKVNAPVHRLE